MRRRDDEAEVFGHLFVAQQHINRMTDAGLEKHDITGRQWLLLAVLVRAFTAAPTVSEAAEVYGSSRQNIKQMALQLQRKGFLTLIEDQADRRALRLQLTEKVSLFDTNDLVREQDQILGDIFSPLTSSELHTLRRLTGKLVSHHSGKEMH